MAYVEVRPGMGICQHPEHETLSGGPRQVPEARVAHEISGFEHDRAQGGTNHVLLRRRTGVQWCMACVDAERLKREHGGVPGRLL